ncbi:Cell division protein FtsB [invertebrate metagenome]|uniref:Cell division protein FtsB n=1 Tax=invertebrate metagenome TaxID=1711999 RepID=A0A2H9T982_9ZZZZ
MQKIFLLVLLIMLSVFQLRLWMGEGSVQEIFALKTMIKQQQADNRILIERNQSLARDIVGFQQDLDLVEEQARVELGMLRKGEQFYLIYDD